MPSLGALMSTLALPAAYQQTVDAACRPLAAALARKRTELGRPLVAGLCGSQGSGKSTMAAFVAALLQDQGLSTAVISLDDLYLTLAERREKARLTHPLLLTRGVPGTHDTALGLALIAALTGPERLDVALPRFDKAADDRAPVEAGLRIQAPVDVVLFEGWCVGAVAQPDAALVAPINDLERIDDHSGLWRRYVNDRLKDDYARLFSRLDMLAMLQAPSFATVFDWRALQERKLAERIQREGGPGRTMTTGELNRFIMHYQRLTEWILQEMPARADIVMPLDADHRIRAVTVRR